MHRLAPMTALCVFLAAISSASAQLTWTGEAYGGNDAFWTGGGFGTVSPTTVYSLPNGLLLTGGFDVLADSEYPGGLSSYAYRDFDVGPLSVELTTCCAWDFTIAVTGGLEETPLAYVDALWRLRQDGSSLWQGETYRQIEGDGFGHFNATLSGGPLVLQPGTYSLRFDATLRMDAMSPPIPPSAGAAIQFGGENGGNGFALSVCWTTVPEPSLLGLLVLGAAALLIRKR